MFAFGEKGDNRSS